MDTQNGQGRTPYDEQESLPAFLLKNELCSNVYASVLRKLKIVLKSNVYGITAPNN